MLISDTALRDTLLFNLRPIKERHKQVCGCETCTMMREYQRIVRQYRLKLLRLLTGLDKERGARYEDAVFPKGIEYQQRPSELREEMLCPAIVACGHQHWKCVLGRCDACPRYEIPQE